MRSSWESSLRNCLQGRDCKVGLQKVATAK